VIISSRGSYSPGRDVMREDGRWKGRLTVLLHDREDLDDDLGGRSDHDLSLSSSFGIDDVVLGVSLNFN
jgi:hypothetical protein